MPKILQFPAAQILNNQTSIEEMYSLSPEAKREVAGRLVLEAAVLLKTLSNRDAAVAELLVDCLRLNSRQDEDYSDLLEAP